MKQTIIDSHAHLGDIFVDARNVIYKKSLRVPDIPDAFGDRERRGFTGAFLRDDSEEAIRELVDISMEKSKANTLENLQKEMDECGIDYVCLLPILPAMGFEDYRVAQMVEPRFVPFTCIDFRLGMDAGRKLLEDSDNGACALKLHPVINNVSLDDPLVEEALKWWARTGKPVCAHCGTNQYYYSEVNDELTTAEFGEPRYIVDLARRHPEIAFVAAHGGGMRAGNLEWTGNEAKGLGNLYTDTTFRSADDIRLAIELFGRDRVMFGTDWPFGSYKLQIEQVMKATEDDQELRDLIFYKNANRLFHVF